MIMKRSRPFVITYIISVPLVNKRVFNQIEVIWQIFHPHPFNYPDDSKEPVSVFDFMTMKYSKYDILV